jgi:P-type Cu2+ transporter
VLPDASVTSSLREIVPLLPAAAEALTMDSGTPGGACFHCGLPVAPSGPAARLIDGAWRSFCCAGCEAVARTIVGQGLGDYYRLREAPTGRRAEADVRFDAYDDPTFQVSFVRDAPEGTREAALILEGIRCSACIWLNEQTLRRLPGVAAASVNYATRRAVVRWMPGAIRLSEILSAVARIGYQASPYDERRLDAIHRSERRRALWRLFVAGFGMMQVMMYAVPAYIAGDGTMSADVAQLLRWASFLLTLPVVGYAAQPFFAGAWRAVRARRLGMDAPVALGIALAFAASVWATLRGSGEVYYDSIAMFVFLLLGGRYLELEARQRAARALDHLARVAPAFAERLSGFPASLATDRVAAASLRPGDMLLVKPGETVAADGTVVRGRGAVAEAIVTGESAPRMKVPGNRLIGGSVNLSEPLIVRVERVGADTVLAGIVRLVERAAGERQPLVELADRYAHWFVLAVLVAAAATAIAWLQLDPARALWVTVSVLVVTCPCALSLATPVALTVATGELARRGLVVSRGHAIEALARATDVVLDKTGTLTHGDLRIVSVLPVGGEPLESCLALACALEQASEHPVGRAIVRHAPSGGAPRRVATSVSNRPGAGIEGVVDHRRYRIGTPGFCSGLAGPPPSDALAPGGDSMVALVRDGEWLAWFEVGDSLKADAAALIQRLVTLGKRVHLLSGDSPAAVARAAAALGVTNVCAAADPAAKRAYVERLKSAGGLVAMVGDGVNDAPVLAQADVSIAMGQGADLAQTKADAVLVSGELGGLGDAFGLSVRAMRIVRENLGWAIAYNLLAIPAAAAGLVTPWMAGLGMAGSSLAVVFNALRLRRPRPRARRS